MQNCCDCDKADCYYRDEIGITNICQNFKPKQEDNVEKKCLTCDYSIAMHWNLYKCNRIGNSSDDLRVVCCVEWKIRRDYNQENKEQKMSYKPTSSCTLKNIIEKAYLSNSSEVHKNVVDVLNAHMICGFDFPSNISVFCDTDSLYQKMTHSAPNRKWLCDNNIIEEEISLKPCPFCGSESTTIEQSGLYAIGCDKCNHSFEFKTKKEATKAWNTRK